jgi:hypothetical protein
VVHLAELLGAVLIAAVLLVTAWLALVTAGMVWVLGQGVSWIVALSIGALLNIAGAAALGWWIKTLVTELPFAALLRQLRGEPPLPPETRH